MNDDEFRCDCAAMTRAIKDEIDAKFANMTNDEIIEHLKNISAEFSKRFPPIKII